MNALLNFLRDEDGPTAVEYAVMLAMIIGVCMVGIGLAGSSTADSFQNSFTQIDTAVNGNGAGADAQGGQAVGEAQ